MPSVSILAAIDDLKQQIITLSDSVNDIVTALQDLQTTNRTQCCPQFSIGVGAGIVGGIEEGIGEKLETVDLGNTFVHPTTPPTGYVVAGAGVDVDELRCKKANWLIDEQIALYNQLHNDGVENIAAGAIFGFLVAAIAASVAVVAAALGFSAISGFGASIFGYYIGIAKAILLGLSSGLDLSHLATVFQTSKGQLVCILYQTSTPPNGAGISTQDIVDQISNTLIANGATNAEIVVVRAVNTIDVIANNWWLKDSLDGDAWERLLDGYVPEYDCTGC